MESNLSFEEAVACVIDHLADDESEDYECIPVAMGVAEIRSRRLAEFCKRL